MSKTISGQPKKFASDGPRLMEWLGSFWSRVYADPELPQAVQQGQALLAAQLWLDYLESLSLLDRNNVPPFHRERWHPITIRQSEAGTGAASLLTIGADPEPFVLGEQESGDYVQGRVFKIGGSAEFENAVSYPLSGDMSDIMTSISDSIVGPDVVLTSGTDFIVRDSTIFFLRNKDPFSGTSFPTRTIVNADGTTDEEIMLWATDVLIDKEFVYNYLGYVLGLQTTSSEYYARMLNGVWDLFNVGTRISYFKSALGAILGEPTILSSSETVSVILENDDATQIITDKNVYTLSVDAELRDSVTLDAVLNYGEFLSKTVRVYDTLDPMKLNAVSEFGEQLKTDLSGIFFGPEMLRAGVTAGVSATWDQSNIVHCGTDANGNPKLKFDLYGNQDDIDLFWENFWATLETDNISSETCFSAYIDDTVVPVEGAVYGRLAPLEYFMRYYLKANAIAVVIEPEKLSSPPEGISPVGLLDLIKDTLPVHVRMYIVESRVAGTEEYDLTNVTETGVSAALSTALSSAVSPGKPSLAGMTYKDRGPDIKWLPVCNNGD